MTALTKSTVFLVPCFLNNSATQTVPSYVLDAVKTCQVFFVENERSARRYLKSVWREMVIDDYQWFAIGKAEDEVLQSFRHAVNNGRTIGIISEAGCPGVADPGQLLVAAAHVAGAIVRPLVGPSSILLALMGSGMNGQQFEFVGYLPIDHAQRIAAIRQLEVNSAKKNSTQIFIETPYRNNKMMETLMNTCNLRTRLCVAADITGPGEMIKTMSVAAWKSQVPELNKIPTIFLLLAE